MPSKRKQHVTVTRQDGDRPVAASGQRAGAYPSVAEAERSPALAEILRRAARAAVCAGLIGSGVALAGCEPPECEATRWGEMKTHGEGAVRDASALDVRDALGELGAGLGISPHPTAPALPGRMMVVTPSPPPSSTVDDSAATE